MNGTEYSELVGNLNSLSDALAREGYAYDAETITKAAREIQEKQERTESPWISTADRLPEEEKDVLILVKETDNTFGTGHPDVCYWQFVGWMIDGALGNRLLPRKQGNLRRECTGKQRAPGHPLDAAARSA